MLVAFLVELRGKGVELVLVVPKHSMCGLMWQYTQYMWHIY